MNIKIKQFILIKLILLAFAASLFFTVSTSYQTVSAEPANTDPVLAHCLAKAPKARASCDEAVKKSRNKASHNCESSKKVNKCIEDKAKDYISEAAKGNPGNTKFKQQLAGVLSKGNGDPNTFSDKANKLGAEQANSNSLANQLGGSKGTHQCGKGPDAVETRFNFGCIGNASTKDIGAIEDLVYALVRFLSYGVGLAIVASIIIAGIQYSTSEGNPETTQESKNRIQSAVVGLVIYLFAFSLLQYLVPGGIFSG